MDNLGPYLIRILFHLVIMLGIWQLIQPMIDQLIRKSSDKNEYRKEMNQKLLLSKSGSKSKKQRKSIITTHIDDLLYLVQKKYEPRVSVIRFYVQMVFVFTAVYFVTSITMTELPNHLTFDNPFMGGISIANADREYHWGFPLFLSFLGTTFPYIRLRYKHSLISVKASFELLDVIKILSKYTYLSVDKALDRTSEFLGDESVLKRPLRILASTFANYSNENELHRAANRFADSISTTFARVFISDLIYAEKEGTEFLSSSLLELNMSMEQQRETIITVKSANSDPITLGLYVNLLLLVAVIGTFMLMLGPNVYYKLQFQTDVGLYFLAFITATLFLAFAVSMVLSRPKLDYQ